MRTFPFNLPPLPNYPLSGSRSNFHDAFQNTPLLIEAEPGAGKSSLVPLWVLGDILSDQLIYVVQPRILSAKNVASRLSSLIQVSLGDLIGYQIPYERKVSEKTRLIVVTPGILLQHVMANPTLEGVCCVILDECHERSVNQDLAWVFLQEIQILRDDFKLVLMSATPDAALQQQIPNYLFSQGRCYPVSLEYHPSKHSSNQYPEKIADHLLRALRSHSKWQSETTLVFLPGWRDIEDCSQLIAQHFAAVKILRLHSRVPLVEQQKALDPDQGHRIILATNIAETSLTIADVTLVIDSGLVRRVDYEQRTGISRLRTSMISSASADQRRGRAGRVQAGHCIRLWSQDQPLAPADLPEIRATDYLPLALRIAHWGSPIDTLPWLEKPNVLAISFAQQQLRQMQLLNEECAITEAGKRVSELGTHPRIATFLISHNGQISRASLLLALALHFELQSDQGTEELIDQAKVELNTNRQWQHLQKRWLTNLKLEIADGIVAAEFVALAYSDRIGYLQDSGKYRLNSGISVAADLSSQWAVFPMVNSHSKGHFGIGVAVQLDAQAQRRLSQQQTHLVFKQQVWQLHDVWRMGGVVIDETFTPLKTNEIPSYLVDHIRQLWYEKGRTYFHWSDDASRLLQRARLLSALDLCELPPLDDVSLVSTFGKWLVPFINKSTQFDNLPWQQGLEFHLGYEALQKIKNLLPERIELPSGRSVNIVFNDEGTPMITAKLQEFFGCEQMVLGGGKIPLQIHLLSPNGSPAAITTNLQTFWQQGYPAVRKDLRGRYPRHPWPENPHEHEATALTKRKLAHRDKES